MTHQIPAELPLVRAPTPRLYPAPAAASLLSSLNLGTLWVQPLARAAPTSSELAAPGGVAPAFRNYMGEMQVSNLTWDNQARDQYERPGFMYGYNLSFARRCLIPVLAVEYLDADSDSGFSSFEGTARNPLWVAATIHSNNGSETFSILTAPRHEQWAATSAHEPVLIAPQNVLSWFDVSIHPSQLLRSPTCMAGTNPLIWKAA